MNELTHVDLYSGLGGFALAARANGIRTTCFCEIDRRCRAFLSKAWPGVEQHDDIRTFDGRKQGGAFLLSAGTPCQPASRAGKQGGADDDRWLWDQTIRVLDDSFGLVDGLHRSVLAALGNSIVWQVAFEIIAAIVKAEQ